MKITRKLVWLENNKIAPAAWLMRHKFTLLGLLFFIATAWFSEGYHHPDEHFQILEMAHFKMGKSSAADLAWEYHERIRPGLQPLLAFWGIRFMETVGWNNPFYAAFLLRLLSAGLVFCMMMAWMAHLQKHLAQKGDSTQHLFQFILFCWFVPYLSVRFSSENWAGLSLLTGLLLIVQVFEKKLLKAIPILFLGGFLVGLSFFFRFQMAFAILGAVCWLLYYRKLTLTQWCWLAAGGAASLLAGIGADYWLYGTWEPTALNYFKANILENKAAQWGTAPWWFYITSFLLSGLPPGSALLLALATWGGIKHRNHLFVWILVPFLIAHSAVGHKELRFLFPMVFPFLALSMMGWQSGKDYLMKRKGFSILMKIGLAVNFLGLLVRSVTPANEAFPAFHYLYQQHQEVPFTLFATEKDPFDLVGLKTNFYRPEGLETTVLGSVSQLDTLALLQRSLLLYPRLSVTDTLQNTRLRRVYCFFPDWIKYVNPNNWQSRSRMWSVYEVSR